MPEAQVIKAVVTDGHIPKHERQRIGGILHWYEGTEVEIEIRPPKRPLSQNRRYWAMLKDIRIGLADVGAYYDKAGLHIFFGDMFLGHMAKVYDTPDGVRTKRPSTTDLNKTQMSDYIEQVRLYALENWGIDTSTEEERLSALLAQ